MDNSEKNIQITGQNNKYLIKKCIKNNNDIEYNKKSINIENKYIQKNIQPKLINFLQDSSINTEIYTLLQSNIKDKRSSYMQQDKKNQLYNEEKIIKYEEIIHLINQSKCLCYYCHDIVFLLYKEKRFDKQWTLDRIDNSIGHYSDNVVISCLECNLQRKNIKQDNFFFNKNLKIIKKNT